MNNLKTFFVVCFVSCVITFLLGLLSGAKRAEQFYAIFFMFSWIVALFLCGFGFHKSVLRYFNNKTYAEEEEIAFQTNLRREIERKRALSQVDNENLHYQNQLRIETIAQIAHIHLQSNQYLANLYQQAIISNSRNQENAAADTLQELEQELKRQGLI